MSKESFRRALKTIHARHDFAMLDVQKRQDEVETALPQIRRLRRTLTDTCEKVTRAVFNKQEDVQTAIQRIKQENLYAQSEIERLLRENGYPADYLAPHFHCRVCGDTGYTGSVPCVCLRELEAQYNVEDFNAGSYITMTDFASFKLSYYQGEARARMEQIERFCREYADTFTPHSASVLMMGGVGLGKTHLSLAIAAEVMKKGYSALYVSAPELFRKLQNEYYGKGGDVDTMDTLMHANLVIIDDLGAELDNQFNTASFYNIINARQNLNRPVIVNTNLTLKEIEQRYSQRTLSRLSVYRCLKFAGTDVRQLKLREQYGLF